MPIAAISSHDSTHPIFMQFLGYCIKNKMLNGNTKMSIKKKNGIDTIE